MNTGKYVHGCVGGIFIGHKGGTMRSKIFKRIFIAAGIVLILTVVFIVWYFTPVKLLKVNAEDIEKITVFDGGRGTQTEFTEREDIEYLAENLSSVTMKRDGISVGYKGYSFRTTVYLKNGSEKSFIINGEYSVRDDPFFYEVTEGRIDYGFIEERITAQYKENSLQ